MRFCVTNELIFDDFVRICEIEKSHYPSEYSSSPELMQNLYKKNIEIYLCVRDNENSSIVGFVSLIPVREEVFNAILKGDFNDSEISADDILKYDKPGEYRGHIQSMVVAKECKNKSILLILYRELKKRLRNFEQKNIEFSAITADVVSMFGEKVDVDLLGMKFVKKTSRNSKIYLSDSTSIIEFCRRKERKIV